MDANAASHAPCFAPVRKFHAAVKKTIFIIALACAALAGAQDAKKPDASQDLAAPLRKFDSNHDGKLTGDELKLARQAHNRGGRDAEPGPARMKEILQRNEREFTRRREKDFDTNSDGKLDDAERNTMRKVWQKVAERYLKIRETITAKYDRNDDGELNDGEREASRTESDRLRKEIEDQCINEWRAQQQPKPPVTPAAPKQ